MAGQGGRSKKRNADRPTAAAYVRERRWLVNKARREGRRTKSLQRAGQRRHDLVRALETQFGVPWMFYRRHWTLSRLRRAANAG